MKVIKQLFCTHNWLYYDEDGFLFGLDPHSKVKFKKCNKCDKEKSE